jgi:hypothetical protein
VLARGAFFSPRSRSLTARALSPARAASSSWVRPRAIRCWRKSSANEASATRAWILLVHAPAVWFGWSQSPPTPSWLFIFGHKRSHLSQGHWDRLIERQRHSARPRGSEGRFAEARTLNLRF